MKKILLVFYLCFGMMFLKAQLPTILATTIIPQSPGPNDIVKIVTHVSTPNQGIIVDLIHSVSHNPKEINLRPCYWQGMLTALQTHIDTFVVGQLQAGVYTINHKAYMSSTQQHCTKTDSNLVVSTLTVGALTTRIQTLEQYKVKIYPSPVSDKLFFTGKENYSVVEIFQLDGRLVKSVNVDDQGSVHVAFLSKGIYFVRFSNQAQTYFMKFIKE